MVSGNPVNLPFHVSNRSDDTFVSILLKSVSSPTYCNMSISIVIYAIKYIYATPSASGKEITKLNLFSSSLSTAPVIFV